MHPELKVAIIQSDLVWENPSENRDNFEKKICDLPEAIDLIILPEMFSTGFTMHPQTVAETMNGETVSWMKRIAIDKKIALTGSIVVTENNKYYNRLLFVHPDGKIDTYNKRHTFTLAGEDKVYTHGSQKLIVSYKGWKICPMICYDLRFPVWARNVEDYDVLIYVANWPKKRISAWDTLLKARAIENMCYCMGVNRVGTDPNGHEYVGHSTCYSVLGEKITHIPPAKEQTEIVSLHKETISSLREKLQFLEDRDDFIIQQ